MGQFRPTRSRRVARPSGAGELRPYVRAWSQAYRDDGLIVIGVHTPEFSFEHDIELVRKATKERAIDYPVAVDNDYEVWSAFANHYWPTLYFVDADGVIGVEAAADWDHLYTPGTYLGSARSDQLPSSNGNGPGDRAPRAAAHEPVGPRRRMGDRA